MIREKALFRMHVLRFVIIALMVSVLSTVVIDPVFAKDISRQKAKEQSPLNLKKSEDIFKGTRIKKVSETRMFDDRVFKVHKNKKDLTVNQDNMNVHLSKQASDGITVEDSDTDVAFAAAVKGGYTQSSIVDNTTVYTSEDGKNIIGITVLSCGIRQTAVLEDENADKEITVSYDADQAGYINYLYDENGEAEGSAILYDKNGDVLVGISIPTAKDNNGVPVETHYEIKGTELTQVIQTTKDTAYPVAAASESYSSYFKSSKWIYRSNAQYKRALSIEPKIQACGAIGGNASWPFLKKKHKGSKYWSNTAGMKNQYLCHAIIPQNLKTPWNIEPKRPYASFLSTCAQGCNPK